MKEQLADLYALQKIDSGMDALKRKFAALDKGDAEKAAYDTANAAFKELDNAMRATNAMLNDTGLERTAVEEKRATEEKKLYSGSVRNPKELTAMQEEVEMLARQVSRLDEKLIMLRDEAETAKQHQTAAKKALSAARAALKAKLAVAQTAADEMSAMAQKLTAFRTGALKNVPQPLLTRYETLRKANQGIGIAPIVDGNTCGGCRMGLPSQITTRVRVGKDIETCPNCGRMLCEGDAKK
jgi:predicted  nucleic acid-binding Zn-ribbon protein